MDKQETKYLKIIWCICYLRPNYEVAPENRTGRFKVYSTA